IACGPAWTRLAPPTNGRFEERLERSMRTVIARGGFAVAMGVWMGASMAGTAHAQGAPPPAPARPLPAAAPASPTVPATAAAPTPVAAPAPRSAPGAPA